MPRACPDCKGRRTRGANACKTCSPSSALGDVAVSLGRRARNAATGKKVEKTGRTTTARSGWLAPTVTKTSKPKPAAKKKPTTPKPAPTTVNCWHGVPLSKPCEKC